jgi:hypothetical protein
MRLRVLFASVLVVMAACGERTAEDISTRGDGTDSSALPDTQLTVTVAAATTAATAPTTRPRVAGDDGLALPPAQIAELVAGEAVVLPIPRSLPNWPGVQTGVGTKGIPPGIDIAATELPGGARFVHIVASVPEEPPLSTSGRASLLWTVGSYELWATAPEPCPATSNKPSKVSESPPRESYFQLSQADKVSAGIDVVPAPGCLDSAPTVDEISHFLADLAICSIGGGAGPVCADEVPSEADIANATKALQPAQP